MKTADDHPVQFAPAGGAAEFGLPSIVLGDRAIPAAVRDLVPRSFVQEHAVLPYLCDEEGLHVAIADPVAVDVLDSLAHVTGRLIFPALAGADDLKQAIGRCYADPAAGHAAHGLTDESHAAALPETAADESEPPAAGQEGQLSESDAPLIKLVHAIISEGIRRRASDIHLEPMARRFQVRYRIDGVLLEAESPPRNLQAAIISRLKIMANISIAEKRVPQDGRIQLTVDGRSLDLRVSSVPTVHGESMVLRILDQEGLRLGLPELGLWPDHQAEFARLIAAPDGMILVTGPTGSGKTTSLYACLHQLNQPGRKIITVEEPVEYQISGINQVPVNAAIGLTFAAALRAMLRQAPNLVMIGEIRDRETAEIAINASLTGHLVFSTLHTNDAPSAVTRLIDIGAKPFLVAAALRASLAQRLVRRNCPRCKRAYTPSAREVHALGLTPAQLAGADFAHGAGCAACHGTGYQGRLGLFEIFLIDDGIRALIHENASASRLRRGAPGAGRLTLRQDGIRKVLAGLTTIEEVVSATIGDEP